jgi:hypothetical protein
MTDTSCGALRDMNSNVYGRGVDIMGEGRRE